MIGKDKLRFIESRISGYFESGEQLVHSSTPQHPALAVEPIPRLSATGNCFVLSLDVAWACMGWWLFHSDGLKAEIANLTHSRP